jgi:hypothetical protein
VSTDVEDAVDKQTAIAKCYIDADCAPELQGDKTARQAAGSPGVYIAGKTLYVLKETHTH